MGYKIHLGSSIEYSVKNSFETHRFCSRLHIAVTQVHTQPGFVEKLLDDTRECVADILRSDNKNDTPTVCKLLLFSNVGTSHSLLQAVIYGTSQKVPDKSLVADMAKLYVGACYDTRIPTTSSADGNE